jgi:hypothetical protein
MSDSAPKNESASPEAASAASQSAAPSAVPGRLRIWHLILAALVASGLAWPYMKRYERAFPMENLSVEMTNRIRAKADDPIAWAKERQNQWEAASRNAMLNLGIFGLCVGGCLGLTGSLNRRITLFHLLCSLVYGIVLGTVAGIASALVSAYIFLRVDKLPGMEVPTRSLIIHGMGLAVFGLFCGLILALTARPGRTGMLAFGGLLGGLIASLVYEPLAAICFQLVRSDIPVPEGPENKLLFLVLSSVLMLTCAWRVGSAPILRRAPRGG